MSKMVKCLFPLFPQQYFTFHSRGFRPNGVVSQPQLSGFLQGDVKEKKLNICQTLFFREPFPSLNLEQRRGRLSEASGKCLSPSTFPRIKRSKEISGFRETVKEGCRYWEMPGGHSKTFSSLFKTFCKRSKTFSSHCKSN